MESSGTKILRYQAHNVKRVSDIDFDLEGRHLFLVGGVNEQGKSSALDALLMALCGRSGMDYPEVALREGENEGSVDVDLSDGMKVRLELKRKRNGTVLEKFSIVDADGKKVREPRKLLKQMYSMKAFDPLEFSRMKPAEQKELLQRITGCDFTESNKEYDKLYQQRRDVNRDVKAKESLVDGLKPKADTASEEVDVSELMRQLNEVRERNQSNREFRSKLEGEFQKYDDLKEDATRASDDVDRLKRQLAEAESRQELALQELKTQDAKLDSMRQDAEKLQDEDETAIQEKINSAGEINKQVDARRRYEKEVNELKRLRESSESLTKRMESIREQQQKTLAEAKMPVEGLSFHEEGVLYDGLPFSQASRSRKTIVSAMIGMALNSGIRLMVCQNGGELDVQTLLALDRMLQEHDYQAIIELVTRTLDDEQLCAVVIEDGRVKSRDGNDATLPF